MTCFPPRRDLRELTSTTHLPPIFPPPSDLPPCPLVSVHLQLCLVLTCTDISRPCRSPLPGCRGRPGRCVRPAFSPRSRSLELAWFPRQVSSSARQSILSWVNLRSVDELWATWPSTEPAVAQTGGGGGGSQCSHRPYATGSLPRPHLSAIVCDHGLGAADVQA